jgi:hypothetical protein
MADMGTAVCAEPVKVGLITDMTGSLSIYGAHVLRSFPYGLEYASLARSLANKFPITSGTTR